VVSGFFAASMALAADSSHVYTWFAGISTAAGLLGVHGAMSVAAGHLVAVERTFRRAWVSGRGSWPRSPLPVLS
jgi:hypothetical protein